MHKSVKSIPAFLACWIICLTSGCAGMAGVCVKSDNNGGAVVYDIQGPHRRAVGRLDARGNSYVLPPKEGEIVRGAGGMNLVEEALDRAARNHRRHHHIESWEWALSWTIIYLIIILIELAIYAAEDAD